MWTWAIAVTTTKAKPRYMLINEAEAERLGRCGAG